MEMIDLSRVIYDGMPKIPILPDVHVQKFLSLEKGHPLNVTELSLPCHAGTHVDAPSFQTANPLTSFRSNLSPETARSSVLKRTAGKR